MARRTGSKRWTPDAQGVAQKARLWALGRRTCRYCGTKLTKKTATLEHLVPVSKGGDYSDANVDISCVACNGEKGELTDEEYQARRKLKAAASNAAPGAKWWRQPKKRRRP